jgi:hypothetical protein
VSVFAKHDAGEDEIGDDSDAVDDPGAKVRRHFQWPQSHHVGQHPAEIGHAGEREIQAEQPFRGLAGALAQPDQSAACDHEEEGGEELSRV